jgi:hypothetical protein
MALYRRFETTSFDVGEQARMGTAYELLLIRLGLRDRGNALTELLATRVIEAYQTGQCDVQDICSHVLARIGIANAH